MSRTTSALRAMIDGDSAIQAAGVADAGQARLAESVGYPAVYVSGSYVNHTRGFPDGTLTLSEITARIAEVSSRTSVPVIADADDGFGGTIQLARTIRDYERAGASALHIEDFATKKHGVPVPIDKMRRNIQVLLDERQDPDFLIIARTDAMAPWRDGLADDPRTCEEEAYERLLAYSEAGVDLVFPNNASNAWIREFGPKLPTPMLVLGGAPKGWGEAGAAPPREDEMTATELATYNVRVVIYATNMLSRAHRFMKDEYSSWLANERFDFTPQDEIDRADANDVIGLPEKTRLLDKYGS